MLNTVIKFPFYVKLTCTLLTILLIGWFAIIGQTILIPLILGFLISILLVPFCNFFERRLYFPRALASIITTILFFGFIFGVFYLIVLQLINISEEWPLFQKQILHLFEDFQRWISKNYGISSRKQLQYVSDNISKTFNLGTVVIEKVFESFARYSVLTLFTFFYILFILVYRRHLVRFLFYIFEERNHSSILSVIYTTQKTVKKYLIGLILQIVIVFSITFLALNFLGIKYSFLIALITGVFNIIPYIGIITSMLITSILTFTTGDESDLILVILTYFIVHTIDANVIMPKIVGSKVKINSLIVIIGLVTGELVWGIMGMFLAIPILAIFKIIFDHVPELKPWGFLLGEIKEEKLNLTIENYFIKRRKKAKDKNDGE